MSELLTRREPDDAAVRRPLIELAGVEKVYRTGKVEFRALRGVDLAIDAGDMVAIVGPSGSGKSTVMNMITGIDRPTAGTVTVDGRRIDVMSEEELAVWRGARVGVIFQFFQLLPTLTALENAMLPLDFSGRVPRRERAATDVRRIFATEGLVLALAGWLLGVPLGYALVWASGEAVGLSIAFVFPAAYVALALAGTLLVALPVMLAPLRRAVRLKPGDALRFA